MTEMCRYISGAVQARQQVAGRLDSRRRHRGDRPIKSAREPRLEDRAATTRDAWRGNGAPTGTDRKEAST